MGEARYAYVYAVIRESDGRCYNVQDSTDYVEDRLAIPLESYNINYLGKYYYPIPTEYGDFNGRWYADSAHTTEWIPT